MSPVNEGERKEERMTMNTKLKEENMRRTRGKGKLESMREGRESMREEEEEKRRRKEIRAVG